MVARAALTTSSLPSDRPPSPDVTAWCSLVRQTAESLIASMQAHDAAQTAGDELSPLDVDGRLKERLDSINKVVTAQNVTIALFGQLSVSPPMEVSGDLTAINTIKPDTVVASDRERLVTAKARVATYASRHCNTLLDVPGILNLISSGN